MKVRGRRRCTDCGIRWSYFDTGSTACPACGSLRSVGVEDERALHTDTPTSLDLSEARSMLDDRPLAEVAGAAAGAARAYCDARGFVRGGELLELDGTVLLATEIRHVAGRLERALAVEEAEERHFVDILAGAETGARPDDAPQSLRAARGLAAADAVSAYRRDVAAWLQERTGEGRYSEEPQDREPWTAARVQLSRLRDHEKRVSALEGDVPTADADALVEAARWIGVSLREEDEAALARARERLDAME